MPISRCEMEGSIDQVSGPGSVWQIQLLLPGGFAQILKEMVGVKEA